MNNITKENFENWLADHYSIYVHINPKNTFGLPDHFKSDKSVTLQIGLNMTIPILDLKVTDIDWSGTLSFNRRPHYIQCPFSAILVVTGQNQFGDTLLFAQEVSDIPQEVTSAPTRPKDDSIVDSNIPSNVISVDFRNRKKK